MKVSPLYNLDALAKSALLEKGFIPDFSLAILSEVAAIHEPVMPIPNFDAKDMRNSLWFSLDNDDSRDLDQLTYAEKLPTGESKIYVAIACVDLLVKIQSAIDNRAANNTTSIYTPTKIFPMLPERLSTDLTSLNPDEDRVSMIFEGLLSAEGILQSFSIYLAYVNSHAKLAYDGVSDWLNGGPILEKISAVKGLSEQIKLQDSIAQVLSKLRHTQGALSLETIEPHTVLKDGIPVAIDTMPKNRGRLLIENFMIVANTISARFADENKLAFFRRVVVSPKRWDRIIDIAKTYGTQLPEKPDSIALEKFLVKQKEADPVAFPDLSLTIIKLLGSGEYRVIYPGKESPGHFGLALRDYTHSTAPNRRFPDLIVQRILLAAIRKQEMPYSTKELENLASHCTMREDDAEKVERKMRKSAAALVLSQDIGKEYDAIVTGVGEKGTWVRVLTPPVEGKLVKGIDSVDIGDKIRVKLLNTDVLNGFIDFGKVD
ncbi:MAG TPA: RNB domain-containing ribonuclease [Parachlamydiaceae bacterium]|nr:RNB domain-containing ribonuclease [Parachlamydiaceae bacterium]